MTVAHLLAFNFALLAAIASPGPALLFLIKTTLTSGRRAGLAAASGLALMAATLSPMILITSGGGPIKIKPLSFTRSAKSAFSDKKP